MACNPTYKGKRYNSLDEIKPDISPSELSKLYHESKESGGRPEFVKAIEDVFNKTKKDETKKDSDPEGENKKAEGPESKDSKDQKAKVLAEAKDIISKTEFDGIHEEMKKDPEQFLKYISEQASGSEEARTELESGKGITNSLIKMATELYPKESISSQSKIDNNGKTNEGRQQESGSKETIHEKGEGKGQGQESVPSQEGIVLTSDQKGIGGVADDSAPSLLEKKEPYEKQISKSDQLIEKAKSEGLDAKAAFEGKRKKIAENNIKLLDKFGLSSDEIIKKLREDGRLETRNCA